MKKIILTCAVTGSAPMTDRHVNVPVTPRQIADQAVDAARAGAAIVHLHVRDPETGAPSMKLELYREVVERIRGSGVDVVLNLTTGPGAVFVPGAENPALPGPGTTLCAPAERIRHVLELKPEICTLDLNTMWFNTRAAINIPAHAAEMARAVQAIGVLPELEVFDSGDIQLAHHLIKEGALHLGAGIPDAGAGAAVGRACPRGAGRQSVPGARRTGAAQRRVGGEGGRPDAPVGGRAGDASRSAPDSRAARRQPGLSRRAASVR